MSGDEKPQSQQGQSGPPERQPIFLLPTPVLAFCGLLLAIQAADSLVLNDSGRAQLLTWFAFVPYRLFGRQFDPTSPWTWAIPIVLILAGAVLLPLARRVTSKGWSQALHESAA